MAKIDKKLAATIDALDDVQLERKVQDLKDTIPQLQLQLEYANMRHRERRHAAQKKALDDARRRQE